MKRFLKQYWATILVSSVIIGTLVGVCIFVIAYVSLLPSKHYHVHFIDSNECFDVKRTEFYKGSAYITFNDGSEIKCGADNVVVYVDHICYYCGH